MVTLSIMSDRIWCVLSYRLPSEPTRLRLAVWRRLKRLGAVVLHDAIWLLPADVVTREAFDWLAEEIEQQGGTAFTWEARSVDDPQDQTIVRRFRADADARYAAVAESAAELGRLAARPRRAPPSQLQQIRRRLVGLERALRLERRRDYFRAQGREPAEHGLRDALVALDGGLAEAATAANRQGRQRAVGH